MEESHRKRMETTYLNTEVQEIVLSLTLTSSLERQNTKKRTKKRKMSRSRKKRGSYIIRKESSFVD